MGIERAAQYGLVGFLADRLLGTGALGTIGAALWGGLMSPDSGEVSAAYDKRRATVGESVKSFFGFEMPEGLFGSGGRTSEDLKSSAQRAEAEAERRQKSDGFSWGKLLLGGAAAMLGVTMLDNLATGPFSPGWYAPYGNFGFGNMGIGNFGYGVFPNPAMNLFGLGVGPWGFLC